MLAAPIYRAGRSGRSAVLVLAPRRSPVKVALMPVLPPGGGTTVHTKTARFFGPFGEPRGTRTPNPLIKSQLLYQLS